MKRIVISFFVIFLSVLLFAVLPLVLKNKQEEYIVIEI